MGRKSRQKRERARKPSRGRSCRSSWTSDADRRSAARGSPHDAEPLVERQRTSARSRVRWARAWRASPSTTRPGRRSGSCAGRRRRASGSASSSAAEVERSRQPARQSRTPIAAVEAIRAHLDAARSARSGHACRRHSRSRARPRRTASGVAKNLCPNALLSGLMDMTANLDTDLLKPTEVAARLRVSRSWVYEAAKEGRIPSVRLGGPDGPLRFLVHDVDAWLERARSAWVPGESATAATRRAARPARASDGSAVDRRARRRAEPSRRRRAASRVSPSGNRRRVRARRRAPRRSAAASTRARRPRARSATRSAGSCRGARRPAPGVTPRRSRSSCSAISSSTARLIDSTRSRPRRAPATKLVGAGQLRCDRSWRVLPQRIEVASSRSSASGMFRSYQPVQSSRLSPPTSTIAWRSGSNANRRASSRRAAPSCSGDGCRGCCPRPGGRVRGRVLRAVRCGP